MGGVSSFTLLGSAAAWPLAGAGAVCRSVKRLTILVDAD